MQAVILAAGMGRRLGELTQNNTKCMVKVNGVTLIERLLRQLDDLQSAKLERVLIVTGYEGKKLRDYIATLNTRIPVEFIDNPIYATTNNIYSLWLAKDYLLKDDTLLFESDLIFEASIIEKLLSNPEPSLALVSKYESWMDGTVVKLGEDYAIDKFIPGTEFRYEESDSYYKTVNVYKFSKSFSCTHYVPFLEAYSKALGNNEYYEQVLRVITLLDKPGIKALPLNGEAWYEIDDVQDLDIAESIFCTAEERLERMSSRQGGYWRYPNLLNFSAPVNPYFPNDRLKSELKANFENLLYEYPSGHEINNLLAGKYLGLGSSHVCMGNGVSELAHAAMELLPGNVGLITPQAEHYIRKIESARLFPMHRIAPDCRYSAQDIMRYYDGKDIHTLLLVNPDTLSGNYIPISDINILCDWAREKGIKFLVDESLAAFTSEADRNTLLTPAYLNANPHLIVLKSVSKAYGVPGLRLGILACADESFMRRIQARLPLWNINSIGEFYMQIFGKYEKHYCYSCQQLLETKARLADKISHIPFLQVIPGQGNFLFCKVLAPYTASDLALTLLQRFNILIYDCSTTAGMDNGEFIRLSVRSEKDNDVLIHALTQIS